MNLTCDQVRDLAPSYVLGALDANARASVREHLETCPEAHAEFAELGGVVPYLLDNPEPVVPRPELRSRLLASFAAEVAASTGTAEVEAPATDRGRPRPAVDRLRGLFSVRVRRLALAGVAALAVLALAFGNVALEGQASSARQYADSLDRALALAATPNARIAVMTEPQASGGGAPGATDGGPGGIAVLPPAGSGVLVMHDLPPTQGAQVYEAWFVANGQAVPVGSFRVGSDGYGYLDGFGTSQAPGAGLVIGLTREPGPGATRPTLPLVAAGTAQARSAQ